MQRTKFILGGLLILAAVVYLIVSSTQASAEYFMTVDEVKAKGAQAVGQSLRLSGAVMGDTIKYDSATLTLTFDIAHVSGDNAEIEAQGGLAKVLSEAVNDPTRQHVSVVYIGPKPDLLRGEAQAILTGKLDSDGVFHADELLLKCPTKYKQAVPDQAEANK
ncbi:MAG: cytochrome c maturation protein CcmE [Chloroflexi bacterium]|nr:cytochrome c maturation protein CcmE [Chloroflexota bacterium]